MNYGELKAALHGHIGREDSPTVANEDFALDMAAAAIVREMTPREADARAIIALVNGVGPLPAGFVTARSVWAGTAALLAIDARESGPVFSGSQGQGAHTIIGSDLVTWPGYASVSMIYTKAPDSIIGQAAASNWLSQGYPDVWLWAAIEQQLRFGQDFEGAGQAGAVWTELARRATVASQAAALSGGGLRMRGR